MFRGRSRAIVFVVLLAGAWVAWQRGFSQARLAPNTTLSLLETLGAQREDDRFERALAPRSFTFPTDHGPHFGFRNEWWYWTGNLASADGRRFGYQLTIFRTGLGQDARAPTRASAWATTQAYMAHFTVTAISGGGAPSFHAFERVSRGALGLADAQAAPFAAWVLDWGASAPPSRAPDQPFAAHLHAGEADVAIDLELGQGKTPVAQGRNGLSQKGSAAGNASYYYSLTRMPTAGTVLVGGEQVAVEGSSWMDREWSTSALEEGQTGWDWFALQLTDGRDFMFFRLRRQDGTIDEHSHGSLVDIHGSVTPLGPHDVRVEVLASWTSPVSGTTYPSRFRLGITAPTPLELDVDPALADQELNVSFRYWEGAVVVRGRALPDGAAANSRVSTSVEGRGYVELTGYDGRLQKTR